jgi:hypothetical protein
VGVTTNTVCGAAGIWPSVDYPDSRSPHNTAFLTKEWVFVQSFGWRSPVERLARSSIEGCRDGAKVAQSVLAEVGSLKEVLAKRLFVFSLVPRAVTDSEDHRSGSPIRCRRVAGRAEPL